MGKDYWEPLLGFLRETMVARRTIDAADVDRIQVTDDIDEAVKSIADVGMQKFGLTRGPEPKRRWFLFER